MDSEGGVRAATARSQDEFGDGGTGGGDANPDEGLAHAASAIALSAAEASAPLSAAGAASLDTALLDRMAALIAESWPGSGIESAEIQFPDTAIAESALVTREPDGSIAVRIAGIDPRIAAVQTARLQLELANALARRRLRIGSLRLVAGTPASARA